MSVLFRIDMTHATTWQSEIKDNHFFSVKSDFMVSSLVKILQDGLIHVKFAEKYINVRFLGPFLQFLAPIERKRQFRGIIVISTIKYNKQFLKLLIQKNRGIYCLLP